MHSTTEKYLKKFDAYTYPSIKPSRHVGMEPWRHANMKILLEKVKMKTYEMKSRKTLQVFFIGLFLIALVGEVSAGTSTGNRTISIYVTVSEVTIVSITPDSLNWTGVSPGSSGSPKAIMIENLGSTNVSRVWFNASFPASLPYGSSNFALHDAGNFLVIRKNETGALWYHPNLVEYNESELIYLTLPSGVRTHGRFRDGQSEYFWALANDTNGNCTNGTLYMGVDSHNSTQQGTIDFSSCALSLTQSATSGCRTGTITQYNATWGYADIMIGKDDGSSLIGLNYSAMIRENCAQVFFYRWNQDLATASSTSYDEDFYNTTIYPGGNVIANVNVNVPYGVPAGQKTGALTVYVQAITS